MRKNGVDRGLFIRGGVWWIRWACHGHEHRQKVGLDKRRAKRLHRKRKEDVAMGICKNPPNGYTRTINERVEHPIEDLPEDLVETISDFNYSVTFLRGWKLNPQVYVLENNGVVVYVGRTINSILGRLYDHVKSGKIFDRVGCFEMSEEQSYSVEKVLIHLHNPDFNKIIPQIEDRDIEVARNYFRGEER